MLNIKKTLTHILENLKVTKTTFPPTSGSAYAGYGGCYYETYGKMVHIHIGVSGITGNSVTSIYTMPSELRPSTTVFAHGTGGSSDNMGYAEVGSDGVVKVLSAGRNYVGVDITYMVS